MAWNYKIVIALVMVSILVSPQFAAAEGYTSFVQELEFTAVSGADEVQNAYDPNALTNYDTWDPVPQGVWYGGWPVESLLRHQTVPDDDFSMAMATVCSFGSNIIMSGAARTLVRLPMATADVSPWTHAVLNIYAVSEDSDWEFRRNITALNTAGEKLNDMKINFTAGTHELVFWSEHYDPTDTSPTDGNDVFTRSGRTYAFVDAPIKPGVLYLFITYAWYASDTYADFYVQPDSLTDGVWNRSTIATYNEEAPDVYSLDMDNFNQSFGYSFDFQHGFGNSAYGFNQYMEDDDEIRFFTYVDLDQVDDSHFLSFMMPYRSTVDNISWEVAIFAQTEDDGALVLVLHWDDVVSRDFILISMLHPWSTNASALPDPATGWFQIKLTIHNDTRIRLPLWDIETPTAPRVNASWVGAQYAFAYDSDDTFNYNLAQWVQHTSAAGTYNYFWYPQHSIQFNDYRWTRVVTSAAGSGDVGGADDMSFLQKGIFAFGSLLIRVGDTLIWLGIPGGTAVRSLGVVHQIWAQYGEFPNFAGRVWDTLVDAFTGIGIWLWRAAQAIRGFLEVVLDLVTWLLGIIILFASIGLAAFCILIAFKFGMAFRKAALGDMEGAVGEVSGVMTVTRKAVGK